jgi:hypothetical protein
MLKNILKRGEAKTEPKPTKIEKARKTTNPWLIEPVINGLRATNIKEYPAFVRANKKLKPQYFENDRIYGRNAYIDNGVMHVFELFDELREITPNTIGYVFDNTKYNYCNEGILKIHSNKQEEYVSDKTLRNENIGNFFKLIPSDSDPIEPEIVENEEYNDRETVHSQSTDLETI